MTPFSRTLAPLKTPNALPSWMASLASLLIGALLQAAPVIQNQPVSQTVNEQDPVTFSVTATGTGALSYQWQKDGLDIPGATASVYFINSSEPHHIGNYTCRISDSDSSLISEKADLNIVGFQFNLWRGIVARWKLDGNGQDALGFSNGIPQNVQWVSSKVGKNTRTVGYLGGGGGVGGLSVAKTSALNLPSTGYSIAGWVYSPNFGATPPPNTYFTMIASQGLAGQQEDAFILRYGPQGLNYQCSSVDSYPNPDPGYRDVKFVKTTGMNGDVLFSGKWHFVTLTYDGSTLRGFADGFQLAAVGNTSLLGVAPKSTARTTGIGMRNGGVTGGYDPANNGYLSDIRLFNRALSPVEVEALYASEASVQFTAQPQSQTVNPGQSATFIVVATGSGSLSYQWQKDGVNIPGATSSSFSLASAQPWHIGDYTVKVTDSVGTVTSEVATLSLSGVDSGIWKSLVAYYPFSGNASDVSVLVNNGVEYGVYLTQNRFGISGTAFQFNGSSHIEFPGLNSLSIGAAKNPFTVSLWFSAASSAGPIFGDYEGTSTVGDEIYSFLINVPSNYIETSSRNYPALSRDYTLYSGSSNKIDQNWHQVVYSADGIGTCYVHVDGVQMAEIPYNANLDYVQNPKWRAGKLLFAGANQFFTGKLDDVRIYNRALSTTEVQALYASEATIPPVLLNPYSAQISATSATLGGNVTSDGGAAISERGVVYSVNSTNSDPLIDGTGVTKLTTTGTTGAFTIPVTGLTQGTNYSFKAYAINSQGTTYTSVATFTTLSANADLSALTLSSGTLSPEFTSGTTSYTASVTNSTTSSLTLTPTVAQGDATIEVRVNAGTYASVTSGSPSAALPLKVGANTVDVRVTAQDGVTQKIYSVAVTRENPLRNLVVAQRAGTRLVDLTYDLDVATPVDVMLEISSDGGATWEVPATSATGAVGTGVMAGTGLVIVWNAGVDWLGNFSDQMRFRIVLVENPGGFSSILAGNFTMGVTSGDTDSNAPSVTVTLSPFFIQQTETTKAQWDEVRSWGVNNGYTDLAIGGGKASNHPVQTVSWWDVVKWCNARSEKEGLTPVYTVGGAVMRTGTTEPVANWSATGYRLPTEAEWEKAARGGVSGKRFPWGTDTISHTQANYYGSSTYAYDQSVGYHPSYTAGGTPYTSPVGSFEANGYGLYDMAGNVWEWCWDWYGDSYYTSSAGMTDPRGPDSGSYRVFRGGGGWTDFASRARCADRYNYSPGFTGSNAGFRPVRRSTSVLTNSVETQNIEVDARDSQTITFAAIPDKLTTDSVNLTATGGGSGNPVSFAVTSGPGVITNNVLTFTTSGSVTITASQAGNDNYLAAEDVVRTFNVTKATSTIQFADLLHVDDGGERQVSFTTDPEALPYDLLYAGSETAPSLPGSYAVTASLDHPIHSGSGGATLTILGLSGRDQRLASGSSQPQEANGTDFGRVILGRVATQTFTITNPGTAPLTLDLQAEILGDDAGDFQVSVAPEAEIPAGGSVSFEVRFAPTQPDARQAVVSVACNALANGPITFAVGGLGAFPTMLAQTITFNLPASLYLSQGPVPLTATASSDLPVTLTVLSGPAALEDGLLILTEPGTVKIEASQEGGGNFAAAKPVVRTLTVKADPTGLTLADLTQTYNGTPRPVTVLGTEEEVTVTYFINKLPSDSPPTDAGSYPVTAVAGPVTKKGTLVIARAPLIVQVADMRKMVGEANPSLTAEVTGFIGEDTENTVMFRPITLSTKAKDNSPPGLYPITSSGGAAVNYTFIHRPGTLVVEGYVGNFEALLRDPVTDQPVGLLKLLVPTTSQSATASLALTDEAKPLALAGPLELDPETRVASAQLSRIVNKTDTYQLNLTLSLFGELAVEVRKNDQLIAQATDGTRLRDAVKGETVPQMGAYTAVLEPAEDDAAPSAPGWATVKVDAAGTLALTGKLGDGTAFTASLPMDVSEGYRFFVQPYKRAGAHLGGTWSLTAHPEVADTWQARAVELTWVKGDNAKDAGYRAGFGPLTVTLEVDAWQPASKTSPLAQLLGAEQFNVTYDPTGSPSEVNLPSLVALDRSNSLLVLAPVTNPVNLRKWKAKVSPATGAYTGSFELIDLSQKRKVNFSGVLRQAADAEADGLQARGHYLLPPLKGAPGTETTTGRMEFRRED